MLYIVDLRYRLLSGVVVYLKGVRVNRISIFMDGCATQQDNRVNCLAQVDITALSKRVQLVKFPSSVVFGLF